MIYEFVLPVNRSTVIVCCWPPGPASFIGNILTSSQLIDSSAHILDTSLFRVSKLVNAEASGWFYRKHIFRFSSSQLCTLLMVPTVLNNLQRIEVEDIFPDQRRWDLVSVLDRLQGLPLLKEAIAGSAVCGRCIITATNIEDRPVYRWCSESRRLWDMWLVSRGEDERTSLWNEHCRMEETCPKAIYEKNEDFFRQMGTIRDKFDRGSSSEPPIQPDEFSYRLVELPKVTILNFKLRARWRNSQTQATNSSG